MGFRARLVDYWLSAWSLAAPSYRLARPDVLLRPAASDSAMRALMSWKPSWSTALFATILNHRQGAFIDVGANAGQSLLDFSASDVRSSYLGFEPNPACARQLAELVSASSADRCRIVPAGLADRSGVRQLYLFGGDSDPGASIDRSLRPALDARPVSVAMFRFDDLDDLLEEPDVALVKIDVEGGELSVLRGMTAMIRAKRPWIICEVLHRDSSADPEPYRQRLDALMHLLRELEYCACRLVPNSAGTSIIDLVEVTAFPDSQWSDASAFQCDYLFVPEADLAKANDHSRRSGRSMKTSIVILIPHFGEWPPWIDFFIESCRANRTIDWILFSDAEPPANRAGNVRHVRTSFADYVALLSEALGIRVGADAPYKLCDVRPALPFVHQDLVRGYDFAGFGDLDVIYGNIRDFYDEETLGQYDLLSSHADRVSGHLCLMRNSEDIVGAFRKVPGWKRAMERPDYVNFDERAFYNLFRGGLGLLRRAPLKSRPCLFREAYSTPAATDRMRWYWQDGRLTNEYYPNHPFMYLHFMSWHSNRWFASQQHVSPGAAAPWSKLPQIVRMDWRDAGSSGFMISPDGIEAIDWRTYA